MGPDWGGVDHPCMRIMAALGSHRHVLPCCAHQHKTVTFCKQEVCDHETGPLLSKEGKRPCHALKVSIDNYFMR